MTRMKMKVVMNSGKEYVIKEDDYTVNDFLESLYNELPTGGRVLKNIFIYLDRDEKIIINPSHISSIEVLNEQSKRVLK